MMEASGLLKLTEHGVNMNTKEVIAFLIFVVVIMGSMFLGLAYDSHLKHECRIEALKALTDVSRINEICK